MEGSQYVSEEGIIYHVQKTASERMRRSESVTIPEPIRTRKGNGPRLDISIYIVRQVFRVSLRPTSSIVEVWVKIEFMFVYSFKWK